MSWSWISDNSPGVFQLVHVDAGVAAKLWWIDLPAMPATTMDRIVAGLNRPSPVRTQPPVGAWSSHLVSRATVDEVIPQAWIDLHRDGRHTASLVWLRPTVRLEQWVGSIVEALNGSTSTLAVAS